MRPTLPAPVLAVLLAALLVATSAHGEETHRAITFNKHGVSLDLPTGVTATERSGPDFLLYYFTEKKHQVLFAYFGFAPSFPNAAPKNAEVVTETVGGFSAQSVRWLESDGGHSRESLVRVSNKGGLQFVHFIYTGLNANDSKRVDAIIASLRFQPADAGN